MIPTQAELRSTLERLAAHHIAWEGPLPEGDLGEHLDSMDRLALVVAVEDHFLISFDEADDDQARTIDDVLQIVATRLSERTHA